MQRLHAIAIALAPSRPAGLANRHQEVLCIHGGAITQLEQREMPAILRNARADAELCGVRCFLEVKPMSFCDFYQRFAPPEIDAD